MNHAPDFLLRPFPEWKDKVRAAFTQRHAQVTPAGHASVARQNPEGPTFAGSSAGPYDTYNMGFRSGDDPARVMRHWNAALDREGLSGKVLALPRMVHGDSLADADALPDPVAAPGGFRMVEPEGADALWSKSNRRVLAVTMADCLTALVFDPQGGNGQGTVAAVHAGWRGARARILEKTLRFLAAAGHIRVDRARVAFGPCLRVQSLQVGEEVSTTLDGAFLIRREGRIFFDMPACNRAQALAAGIDPAHLHDFGGDTLSDPAHCFSYRRDGQASGRMAAFIALI